MDKSRIESIFEDLSNWANIIVEQIHLLKQFEVGEITNKLVQLEIEKREIKSMVMQYELNYVLFSDEVKSILNDHFKKISDRNNEFEEKLKQIMLILNSEMKKTTTHHKILTTYGGAQSKDFISFYLDSKK